MTWQGHRVWCRVWWAHSCSCGLLTIEETIGWWAEQARDRAGQPCG